jgi:cytochrome c-type biogenesis protein CcmH/NrfG
MCAFRLAARRDGSIASAARHLALASILLACVSAAPRSAPLARPAPAQQARLHHRWAEESLAENGVEARLRGVRHIREAIALEPGNAEHWLVLGRLRALGEYDSEARSCFRRAIVLAPRDLRGYLELAAAWKRQWALTLDTLAVARRGVRRPLSPPPTWPSGSGRSSGRTVCFARRFPGWILPCPRC